MDYRLVYCLRNGLPLDMDVYDLAEWCCLGELTALSLENNSAPVADSMISPAEVGTRRKDIVMRW